MPGSNINWTSSPSSSNSAKPATKTKGSDFTGALKAASSPVGASATGEIKANNQMLKKMTSDLDKIGATMKEQMPTKMGLTGMGKATASMSAPNFAIGTEVGQGVVDAVDPQGQLGAMEMPEATVRGIMNMMKPGGAQNWIDETRDEMGLPREEVSPGEEGSIGADSKSNIRMVEPKKEPSSSDMEININIMMPPTNPNPTENNPDNDPTDDNKGYPGPCGVSSDTCADDSQCGGRSASDRSGGWEYQSGKWVPPAGE